MIVAGIAVAAAARGDDAARPLVSFTKHRLDERFFAEGAGVGDFNNDGTPDVVAGPFWFAGPDFNADGWDDILIYGFPGNATSWFENPGRAAVEPKIAAAEAAAPAAWKRHVVLTQGDNESPTFADIDGDGRPEIDPLPVFVPVLMRELGNSLAPRASASEGAPRPILADAPEIPGGFTSCSVPNAQAIGRSVNSPGRGISR